jgi:N-acetylneuraminate synthase/N,N'-diacetyllegionaminate synthase
MRLGSRKIGPGSPCFVIAEAGVNHNGDPALAGRLIDIAAEAGADAVKFQTFCADQVIAPDAPKAAYQKRLTDPGESQLNMIRGLELSEGDFCALSDHCRKRHILFLSTPFDLASVDMLLRLDVPGFKIASGEVTNLPLLRKIAATGLPAILSTGMSDLDEVASAVRALQDGGCSDLALLHCVSNYPAPADEANLRAMQTLADAFQLNVGYSDHTAGLAVTLAAVALGACIIEKHFTVDKTLPGPDHQASLDPAELREMVKAIRAVEASLGDGVKRLMPSEADTRRVARRSLYLARDKRAGETIVADDLIALRPADGIDPMQLDQVIGSRPTRDLAAGSKLEWADLRPAVEKLRAKAQ